MRLSGGLARLVLAATVFVLTAAGCSGGGSASDGVLGSEAASPVSSETVATTTPTTEPETTTTTEPEPPTLDERLLAFHREYYFDQANVDTADPAVYDELIAWLEENAVDPQRARGLRVYEEEKRTQVRRFGPGDLSNVTGIDWDGGSGPADPSTLSEVRVHECSLDRLAANRVDGSSINTRAGLFAVNYVDYVYERAEDPADERWWVKSYVAVDELCDPVEQILLDAEETEPDEADLDAILAVSDRFLTETWGGIDQRAEGYESTLASIAETTTSSATEDLEKLIARLEKADELADGKGWTNNVVDVRVRGDEAAVVTCTRPLVSFWEADGSLAEAPSPVDHLFATFLKNVDGQWLVEFFWQGGEQECDPADYQ